MSNSFAGRAFRVACAAAAIFGFASTSLCQGGPAVPTVSTGVPNQTMIGQSGGTMNDQLQYGTMGHQAEREQNDAYQAFLKERDSAKKIQKGREFLRRYPKSSFEEQVDATLMDTYRTQADWTNEYQYADQALALNPKDVDVLATVGWTIPHVYKPTDPDAAAELDKAEKFSKQALEDFGDDTEAERIDRRAIHRCKSETNYSSAQRAGPGLFPAEQLRGLSERNGAIDQGESGAGPDGYVCAGSRFDALEPVRRCGGRVSRMRPDCRAIAGSV